MRTYGVDAQFISLRLKGVAKPEIKIRRNDIVAVMPVGTGATVYATSQHQWDVVEDVNLILQLLTYTPDR
jgi:hypothetical protein